MRRDMNLIRQLLLEAEGEEETSVSDYTDKQQILYHKYLLIDAGFALGDILPGQDEILAVSISLLTWKGHDFLDAARNETIWKKAMVTVKNLGGSTAFEVVKALLIALAKDQIGLP